MSEATMFRAAVNIAKRGSGHAEPGDTRLRDNSAGDAAQDIILRAGTTELRGVPEQWKLYRWLPQR
jgi:class 3 adenylate cyclase